MPLLLVSLLIETQIADQSRYSIAVENFGVALRLLLPHISFCTGPSYACYQPYTSFLKDYLCLHSFCTCCWQKKGRWRCKVILQHLVHWPVSWTSALLIGFMGNQKSGRRGIAYSQAKVAIKTLGKEGDTSKEAQQLISKDLCLLLASSSATVEKMIGQSTT